jgi:hypothetical protein
MAADAHFTQISNALFRDPRVSFKAKGIFGLISTHRDGFGITPETIAHCGKEGVAAIKTALRELEAFGYLDRAQERRPDGTMGPVEYYITDMPRSEPGGDFRPAAVASSDEQRRRSEPVGDYPLAVEPPAADHAHKNTNSKHTSPEKTLSPRVPYQAAPVTPVPGERETRAAPKDTPTAAQRAVRAAGVVSLEEEAAFIAWCTAKFLIQGPGWWRVCAADLPEHAAAWRADQSSRQAPGPVLPPWCGSCGDGGAAARTNPRFRTVVVLDVEVPCPDCHPDSGLSFTRVQ